MKRDISYQSTLIALGIVASLILGVFFYREIFPEYLEYQNRYVALEQFRSTLTHVPPAPFKEGVKQLVMEREDKGPATVDRCISCHVALQVEAYSPTRLKHDVNGNLDLDSKGFPVKEANPDYIWLKLDEMIAKESDPEKKKGWEALKTVHVGDADYDVKKVLSMHPLIGRETRPFEYHPVEEWGCTSCHGGNGRGLVTDRAHGPVLDGQYEAEEEGFTPQFLEADPKHDPAFSKVFNHKPGHRLLFQTQPIYVGALIQAKCVQCHQSSKDSLSGAQASSNLVVNRKEKELSGIQKGYQDELLAVYSAIKAKQLISEKGVEGAIQNYKEREDNYLLPDQEREFASSMVRRLKSDQSASFLNEVLLSSLGSEKEIQKFLKAHSLNEISALVDQQDQSAKGTLFEKKLALQYASALLNHLKEVSGKTPEALAESEDIGTIQTDIDLLTKNYLHGEQLFLTQGCYACHRIAGRSRGGVGPELTRSGESYPWFVKQSIVWPQADLKTSTMPNFRLDHEELEDLVTYLLGQTGHRKSVSETSQKIAIQEWESGRKLPWEKPVSDKEVHDLKFGMKVFATEGCASCHRLQGFDSDAGIAEDQHEWFKRLFPEDILGSTLIAVIEKNQADIDARITLNRRKGSILEEIEKENPGLIESFYSPFKFAARAKEDPQWKERVHKVLMQFVQSYGLGRLICPRPNWSGIYRSDSWLMEHFKSPTSLVPRSIMPAFPFDMSKFKALTYTLDQLARKNIDFDRRVVDKGGFQPEVAYNSYCAQCHGETRQGNGPVSTWIYPIPKNLMNAEFMRNLTKAEAKQSILHGVKGTPMPPWGEVGVGKTGTAVLSEQEVDLLVDWLFADLPGATIITSSKEVPKWNYSAEEIDRELNDKEIFVRKPLEDSSQEGYYIKSKFYTPENIEAGKQFFWTNCAPCHGKEADGAGLRAEAMQEAKPRMLTNVEWLRTRDDLRLLRSIKFGVPGTAMTPWGDLTNPLQRIQLVVFIRSLSEENEKRAELRNVLDQSFPEAQKEKLLFLEMGKGFLNLSGADASFKLLIERIQNNNSPEKKKQLNLNLIQLLDQKIAQLTNEQISEEGKIESIEKRTELHRLQGDIAAWKKQRMLVEVNLNKAEKP